MAASDLINLSGLLDDAKCFALVRQHRWPEGARCPVCDSGVVIRDGHDDTQPHRQRYRCKACAGRFDDLTGTVLAGHHQPAGLSAVPLLHGPEPFQPADRVGAGSGRFGRADHDGAVAPWLGRQNASGGTEGRGGDRRGLHRGRAQGAAGKVGQRGRFRRCRKLAGAPGRGTLEKDKLPILGLIQRGGQVVLRMLANVQQATIKPIITAAVAPGTLVHTDEYSIYARLPAWGYGHKTVCHGRGEYARDENGDGFCEVHVNTMEGFWSLLRSWLRPHRGISQDKLPLYLGFFQFVHNARRRGKALLGALIAGLVA